MDRCKIDDLFADELEILCTLSEQLNTMSAFIAFTQNPKNANWNAYLESFQNISKIYTVSKPYVLRAVEASHAALLLFADDEAVCETMKPTSSIGGALHMAVSGEELVSLLAAKG